MNQDPPPPKRGFPPCKERGRKPSKLRGGGFNEGDNAIYSMKLTKVTKKSYMNFHSIRPPVHSHSPHRPNPLH